MLVYGCQGKGSRAFFAHLRFSVTCPSGSGINNTDPLSEEVCDESWNTLIFPSAR